MNVAAISYDSQEILSKFSETRGIRIPLLSDPNCDIIKSFQVLMKARKGPGTAWPGYYVLDSRGVITHELFFEDLNEVGARSTPLGLLSKMFPATLERNARTVQGAHVKIEVSQSDDEARWRNRIVLRVAMQLPPGFHAYAPEVTGGYKPLKLELPESEHYWSLPPVNYPKPRIIDLPKLGEKLPVFEGKFQLTTEAAIKWAEFEQVMKEGKPHKVEIQGTLHYQICDASTCFPPESRPVSWTINVMPYDSERVSKPAVQPISRPH